jgi:hypothetical protein
MQFLNLLTYNFHKFLDLSIFEQAMAVALIAIFIFCIATAAYFIFWLIDTSFLTYQKRNATIVYKTFEPAHYTTTYQTVIINGQSNLIPIQTYVPDSYVLTLQIGNLLGYFSTNNEFYNSVKIHDEVTTLCSKKRFSAALKFKEITDVKATKTMDFFKQ